MILQKMTEEELARIAPLVEPHIPAIETRTGLSRKFIREVLLVSTYFLMREQSKGSISLDRFITKHCRRVSSDLAASLYDVRDVFESWLIELVRQKPKSQNGKEEKA